jgi:hypothetical protein
MDKLPKFPKTATYFYAKGYYCPSYGEKNHTALSYYMLA